jgi:uncharacterized protein YdhG (YjbR/CyaY superfamily)
VAIDTFASLREELDLTHQDHKATAESLRTFTDQYFPNYMNEFNDNCAREVIKRVTGV